jgi:hypothetical protein
MSVWNKRQIVNARDKITALELAAGSTMMMFRWNPTEPPAVLQARLHDFSPGYLLPPLMARTTAISNIAPTTAVIRAPHIPLLGIFSNPNTYPPMYPPIAPMIKSPSNP